MLHLQSYDTKFELDNLSADFGSHLEHSRTFIRKSFHESTYRLAIYKVKGE